MVLGLCAALLPATVMGAKKQKVAVTVDPSFKEKKISRIAVLQVITPSGVDDRVYEMEDPILAAIQEQGEFDILFPTDFKAAAERGGAAESWTAIDRVWHSRREIEGPQLQKVQQATSIDALVGVEVTHFEQHRLDFSTEGTSTTTVGLKVWMFDARDKKLLWQASQVYVAESPPYNPSNSVASDASGVTRQVGKNVPEPPEYDDTYDKVIQNVIGTYPKAESEKESDKKDSKKKKKEKESEEDQGR
jgi:hypothetical protein